MFHRVFVRLQASSGRESILKRNNQQDLVEKLDLIDLRWRIRGSGLLAELGRSVLWRDFLAIVEGRR